MEQVIESKIWNCGESYSAEGQLKFETLSPFIFGPATEPGTGVTAFYRLPKRILRSADL